MIKSIFYSLLVIVAFSSCGHQYNYLYTPNEGNTLALQKEKDLKASAAYGSPASQGAAVGLQVGYSPIKHLGIQSGFLTINAEGEDGVYTNQHMANLAVGTYFFRPFKNEANKNLAISKQSGILIDFYSGLSYGVNKNEYSGYSTSAFNFNKYFIQGGFHVQEGGFGVNILFKAGRLKYTRGEVSITENKDYLDAFERLNNRNPFFFFESTWKANFGRGHTRIYFAFTLVRNKDFIGIPVQEQTWATGITLDIGELNQKKKKRKR